MAQELTVVVTGSTGKQGGAVARGLKLFADGQVSTIPPVNPSVTVSRVI
ncbi:hypothetical protein RBB77_13220 [Tunturibacter psychrotolerans]|uniref:NmrA-like domain-containing protein n=1 Tax=Tunturiibacter psychrotolerans TaxID=3069686 RepID=A0AAU7ZLK5_9BACT